MTTTLQPDIAQAHRRALDATGSLVGQIRPDQWRLPTPDDDWDVRALVGHVVEGNLWAAELAGGRTIDEVGDRFDGDVLGADPRTAYADSAAAAAAAFEEPGALDAACAVSYGPVPGRVYAGHRLVDVLVHGWDLAVAVGGNPVLDPELVELCLALVEPDIAVLKGSGAFGGDVPVPDHAPPQMKLLALLGRQA